MRKKREPQNELPYFPFDVNEMLAQAKSRFPETRNLPLAVRIFQDKSLAYIDADHLITLHPLLNHSDTPRLVIDFILHHELLHRIVLPREIDGKRVSHPPEFFDMEKEIFPERDRAWVWIHVNLDDFLRRDKKQEATFVRRNWKKFRFRRIMTLEKSEKWLAQISEQMRKAYI